MFLCKRVQLLLMRSFKKKLAFIGYYMTDTILVTTLTIGGSLVGVFIGKALEKNYEIAREIRKEKIENYRKYLNIFYDLLDQDNSIETSKGPKKKESSNAQITERLKVVFRDHIYWASAEVIRKNRKFLNAINAENKSDEISLGNFKLFEDLLLAIRRDIGHSTFEDFQLNRYDLIKYFANDVDKHKKFGLYSILDYIKNFLLIEIR